MTKENYHAWLRGGPRRPANPYGDPDSPESQALTTHPAASAPDGPRTLDLRKECRDGGKARKEGT